jgi:isopenicillin N synthase-like dioxygenase
MTDGTAGLQVKPRDADDWIDVPHVDGAFVVNIGDLLMRWTNDVYVSNPHRVQRPRRSAAPSPSSWTPIPTAWWKPCPPFRVSGITSRSWHMNI